MVSLVSEVEHTLVCSRKEHSDEPHWLAEVKGCLHTLPPEETTFFSDLIKIYLKPLKISREESAEVSENLLMFRNKMATGYFMFNAVLTVLIFVLQRNTDKVCI